MRTVSQRPPATHSTGPTAHRVVLQQIKARLLEEIPLFPPSPATTADGSGSGGDDDDDGHNVLTMLRLCLALPAPSPAALGRQQSAEEREEAVLRQRRRKRVALEGPVVVTQEDLLKEVGM